MNFFHKYEMILLSKNSMAAYVLGKQKRHISAATSDRGVAHLRKGEARVQTSEQAFHVGLPKWQNPDSSQRNFHSLVSNLFGIGM
jgi:hypothetical protein